MLLLVVACCDDDARTPVRDSQPSPGLLRFCRTGLVQDVVLAYYHTHTHTLTHTHCLTKSEDFHYFHCTHPPRESVATTFPENAYGFPNLKLLNSSALDFPAE